MGTMLSKRMVLIPVSPSVFPPDPRWPAHVHLTGYWFSAAPPDWIPPAGLHAFLSAGERPVAVSLGAMSLAGDYTRQAARITLEAIRQAGLRAVVQGWDEALRGERLPETVFHAGSLPHSWLFEQVRAVVHHGGFGTTASGLRAGVPAVVIPHIIDQLYWGDRVNKLGAGPRPIHRAGLTVEKLAAALRQAAGDQQMQARAAEIGAAIRAEPDGIAAAVRWIERAP
jgi:sterol 3beta-glucosyltransferase